MQKRLKTKDLNSPGSEEDMGSSLKKKNNSRSALEVLETSNASVRSTEPAEGGTPKKKSERRLLVCHEILDTEDNYLRVLNVLIEVFKKPLETFIQTYGEKDMLSLKELQILFKKIQPIVQVHTYLCQNLHKQLADWKDINLIGKIWADSAPDLERVYPPYINSYDDILKTLDFCESVRPKFHAFLKQAEARPECQKNSVRDLLIRPVQRIPSVLLLLQELQKRTDRNNPDYAWVKAAVEQLKGVLNKTNESRRRTENFQRFMEVCQEIEDLPVNVIASDREFVQQIDVVVLGAGGTLHKYKGRNIGLFLFNDFIEVAKCRFCTSGLDQTMNSSSGGLNSSFNSGSGSSGGTLTRQMSLGGLRRGASWKKERRQYKHVELYRFSNFRSVELEREHGVFMVKIRDQKADEMCFFQPTNGYNLDTGIDFFTNLIQRIRTNSTRDITMEEVSAQQIRNQGESSPVDVENIMKAVSIAAELNSTGTIRRRRSQLRRSVSSLSLSLQRIPSFKRATPLLSNIKE